jgi:hypothetical protein
MNTSPNGRLNLIECSGRGTMAAVIAAIFVEPYRFGTGTADPVDMRDFFGMPLGFLRHGQRPNQHTQRPTINVEERPK